MKPPPKIHDPVEIIDDLYEALETAVELLWEHCPGLEPRITALDTILAKSEAEALEIVDRIAELEARNRELVEGVEPLLIFHETGGHLGDGSDETLAAIRALLTKGSGQML